MEENEEGRVEELSKVPDSNEKERMTQVLEMSRGWRRREDVDKQPSQPNETNHQDVQYSDTTCSIFYFRDDRGY